MSKLKSALKILTLGFAFSSPTQLNHNEQQILPTLKEYNSQYAPQTSLRPQTRPTQDMSSQESLTRPQMRPDVVKNNTFDEFLQYLAWIDRTGKISNPLNQEQLHTLREIFLRIPKTSENNLSQEEKDFRMYYNRHKYELERPLLLSTIRSVLNAEPPEINRSGNLEILIGRAPNYYEIIRSNSQTISSVTFYPNEKNSQLNRFILQNINNPNQISMGTITNIHDSYYRFLVALLLQENNFGNETTSSANAQGKFQIKPNTQQFVIDTLPNLPNNIRNDPDSLGFLHLFQLAKLFGVDITRKPSEEEIILLSYTYFQGPNSYLDLYDLNNSNLNKIRNYPYNILLVVQENNLFKISQDIRKNHI